MEYDFQTLTILTEVLVAFVAFSSIVASINLTIGKSLNPFQRLLIHFFIESGMMSASMCLLPLVLWNFFPDEALITRITSAYIFVASLAYQIWYLKRRRAIDAPTPWTSAAIMVGYFLWIPVFAINASGMVWEPRLASIEAAGYWALVASAVVFSTFLNTFLDSDEPDPTT